MMGNQIDDYGMLRSLPDEDIDSWLHRTYPEGRPAQWWNSVLESVESEVIRKRHSQENVQPNIFGFALHMLRSGNRDSVDLGYTGHWFTRFSALAMRSGVPVASLPAEFTPDGATRAAIALIPLDGEQAVTLARLRNSTLDGFDSDSISDEDIRALQDCELIVHSLGEIRDLVTDAELRERVRYWFSIYDRMAPDD